MTLVERLNRRMLARGVRTALVVGTALTLINQGSVLIHGPFGPALVIRIGLNYAVPLLVSLYSMVGMAPSAAQDGPLVTDPRAEGARRDGDPASSNPA